MEIIDFAASLACVCGVFLLLTLLYKIYIVPFRLLRRMGVSYPIPKPLIGNTFEYDSDQRHITQVKRREKYGKVYGTLFFTIPTIWVGDPDVLNEILVKDFSTFPNRYSVVANFARPFDKTLLELKDNDWKRVRNVMVPTFSALKLKSIMPFINKAGDDLLESLLKACDDGKTADMWRTCGKFTMQVIFATAFGIEFESQEQEKKFTDAAAALFKGSPGILQLLVVFSFSLFACIEPLVGGNFVNSMNYLTQVTENVIRERRRNLKQGLMCRRDILQQMIEANEKDKLNDDEIISQAFIFLAAGYETTANTLAFASYSLATNPDIQQKLINEIDANCHDTGEIEYDTVNSLPYLDMIISETLRKYPPAFFVNRVAKEDATIRGIHIPKGVMIALPIYGVHHDPELWPNPEQFNPERFTPDEKAKRRPCSYIPFGGGPRNCIGMRLALLEVKIALIKILQNAELITVKETEIPLKIRSGGSLQPVNGVYVGIRKRY